MNSLDRRTIKDRRIATAVNRADLGRRSADSLIIAILPPEEEAARIERIYDSVPMHKRAEIGLTYAHIRAVLEVLR